MGLLPAIALAVLPKCPMCLGAYFGVLGIVGASPWLHAAWGTPLWTALLSFTVGALAWRARRNGDWVPLMLGVAGAAAMLAGKYFSSGLAMGAGISTLMGASVWSSRSAHGLLRHASTTDSLPAAQSAGFVRRFAPFTAACALLRNLRTTDSLPPAKSTRFLLRFAPFTAACALLRRKE